jgi:hypothetical protein
VTIATDSGGRQRTSTDGLAQATRAVTLTARAATWLRDEGPRLGCQLRIDSLPGIKLTWLPRRRHGAVTVLEAQSQHERDTTGPAVELDSSPSRRCDVMVRRSGVTVVAVTSPARMPQAYRDLGYLV